MASSQPTQDLDPEDTEAIIAAFLDNATDQGWNDTAVNDVLEEILRQDAAQGGDPGEAHEGLRQSQYQCRIMGRIRPYQPRLRKTKKYQRRRKRRGKQKKTQQSQ